MISSLRSLVTRTLRRIDSLVVASTGVHKMRYFANPYESAEVKVPADAAAIHDHIRLHVHEILHHVKADSRSVDGGLYVGSPGIAYMLYYLAKKLETESQVHLNKAVEYIMPALKHPSKDRTSFLLGDAGNQAIAVAIYNKLNDPERASHHLQNYRSLFQHYLDPGFLKCGGDELFVGRAGYLAGALWLSRELHRNVLSPGALHQICDVMVASGRDYARRHHSPCPLMYAYYKTEYLGAAHGLSFILQMLITVPGYLASNASASADIRASIDYLLSLQTADGNWPCAMDEVGQSEHKLVHWCHGAPGVVYLMARAHLVFGDKRYLDSCVKAAEIVWKRGLLRKGPGICHGVAGSGLVFLLMYRLTKDDKYLQRAYAFADFLQTPTFHCEARTPDNPFSLYEGTAGTVCFLVDLLTPEQAEFPFQDVFTMYEFN